jgi:uncharacterized membrane protein YhhN
MSYNWLFIATIIFALVDWYAAWKEDRLLLFIAKPGTLFFLILWSLQQTSWQGVMIWYGLGLILSLAGDVALLFSARWFLLGLGFFLLAHVMFIVGFNSPLPGFTFYSALLAIFVGLIAAQVLKKIRPGIEHLPSSRIMIPASLAYGLALTLMWLSALLTLFNSAWMTLPAIIAALGGSFFFISDSTLSYDRFIRKLPRGRFWVHVTYHLGVVGILIGSMLNFLR